MSADWTANLPTQPGIYRVRGWDQYNPRRVAVVVVKERDGGLAWNFGARNTEHHEPRSWEPLGWLSRRDCEGLEWLGPGRIDWSQP